MIARAPAARILAFFVLGAAAVSAGACSSNQSMPPNFTCDAGCVAIVGISGGVVASDSGAPGCTPAPSDTACVQCAKTSCCQTFELCFGNASCSQLSTCESSCAGAPACITLCQQESPQGAAPLAALDDCARTECPACTQSGVGDPCAGTPGAQSNCATGLMCNGEWCTKACATSGDCVGLGTGGTTADGDGLACVGTATNGNVCFPECGGTLGCTAFPATACTPVIDVDGVEVSVCENVFDAGAD